MHCLSQKPSAAWGRCDLRWELGTWNRAGGTGWAWGLEGRPSQESDAWGPGALCPSPAALQVSGAPSQAGTGPHAVSSGDFPGPPAATRPPLRPVTCDLLLQMSWDSRTASGPSSLLPL